VAVLQAQHGGDDGAAEMAGLDHLKRLALARTQSPLLREWNQRHASRADAENSWVLAAH